LVSLVKNVTDTFVSKKHKCMNSSTYWGIRDSCTTKNNLRFPGEYGFCMYVYFLAFPTDLQKNAKWIWKGINRMNRHHSRKVIRNLDWYSERFDSFIRFINRAVAYSGHNQKPGTNPPELFNICTFLDGTFLPVWRIHISHVRLLKIEIQDQNPKTYIY